MPATGERRAGSLPRLMIATATRVLPRGVSRDRYRREFAAELHGLSRGRQLGYACGVCAHVWALRIVLVKGLDAQDIPILCRTNIHHHWRKYVNEENVRFELCARCGKERGPIGRSDVENSGMAGGWLSGNVM
jgi:hypothetical protein